MQKICIRLIHEAYRRSLCIGFDEYSLVGDYECPLSMHTGNSIDMYVHTYIQIL